MNRHVARFVVWGKRADYLISRQPWTYAFGRESVLERLVELDGKILALGCDHDNVTFLHYAEHIVDIPDKRVARYKVPIMENGARVWRDMEEFNTAGDGVHANWPSRFFATIVDNYLAATENRGGLVGDAKCFGLLSVDPFLQRKGVGRALIDAAEKHCRSAGCQSLELEIVNLRSDLPDYYTSLGFAAVGTAPFPESRKLSRDAHLVRMSKPLAPIAIP